MPIRRGQFVVVSGVLIGLVFLFAMVVGFVRFAVAPSDGVIPRADGPEDTMCTMEAKLCPDGTAVGRSGPRCEFAPCPSGEEQSVNTFESCVAAGNPVMESYPRRCAAGGVTYTENIGSGESSDMLRVSVPQPNDLVASPLVVQGEARGNWYFEASFPIQLLDADGNVLTTAVAEAQSDWMTTAFVPFQATLNFVVPKSKTGTLVFEKNNPSGLPEHAATVRAPVHFSDGSASTGRAVQLYFYAPEKDQDESGNILCSRQGLVAVPRIIPFTSTPIQDTIKLLLRGELTASERAQGITTEYPLPGVALSSARLEDGTLTLSFSDEAMRTNGGACRVGILWAQIDATARQFNEVKEVKFSPEELFQP